VLAPGTGALDSSQVEQLQAAVISGTTARNCSRTRLCLNRFISHLVTAGVARLQEPPLKAPTPLELLHRDTLPISVTNGA
jgi:hypothetical protein